MKTDTHLYTSTDRYVPVRPWTNTTGRNGTSILGIDEINMKLSEGEKRKKTGFFKYHTFCILKLKKMTVGQLDFFMKLKSENVT